MRIACPNCSAEYEVPELLLATGPRMLRCARCTHRFEAALPGAAAAGPAPVQRAAAPQATPPAAARLPDPIPPPAEPRDQTRSPEPPPLEVDAPLLDRPRPTRGLSRHSPIDPPAPPDRPARRPGQRFAATVALAWALSLLVIGIAAWATYTFHAEITEAFPPAARLYRALGLH